MTADEERALLLIAQQTTSETLRRYPRLRDQTDEILSDALLGIARALERYDPSLGVPLGAYARTRVRGEVLDGLRRRSAVPRGRHRQGATIADLIPSQRPPLPLEDLTHVAACTEPGYAQVEARLVLAGALSRLRHGRAHVIIEYYLRGRSLLEIATDLGISESACSQRLSHAMADLRKALAA